LICHICSNWSYLFRNRLCLHFTGLLFNSSHDSVFFSGRNFHILSISSSCKTMTESSTY
jgi:hypothetical protein